VGFLAGIYPSFILSSFNPVVVLKGNFTGHSKGKWIRTGLLVFQFWISIVLMIGTLVIQEQMQYMRKKSLGFDKDQMLVIERVFSLNQPGQPDLAETFMNEVRRMPEVAAASGSFALPGRQNNFFGIQFQPEGSSEILTTKSMVISDQLAEVLDLELLEGRWFSEATNDSLSILLNEAALKEMEIDSPLGKHLSENQQAPDGSNITIEYTIVGIVKDFNFQSLRDEITPLVIQSNEKFGGGAGYLIAKIKGGQINSAIVSIEAKWKQLAPEQPFKFTFLDEDINNNYIEDQKTGKLFAVFSGLAIFVACIGLFALSAYTASLRTKEIGIRKVLGASVTGVMLLLSKDFTRMVMVSFVLAVPVAWYVMENWWLQNFAYRINISLWIILVSGAVAFFIAWFTVSFQSVRAAVKNPVSSLRSE
jgi:putative ABC transport system permease protein